MVLRPIHSSSESKRCAYKVWLRWRIHQHIKSCTAISYQIEWIDTTSTLFSEKDSLSLTILQLSGNLRHHPPSSTALKAQVLRLWFCNTRTYVEDRNAEVQDKAPQNEKGCLTPDPTLKADFYSGNEKQQLLDTLPRLSSQFELWSLTQLPMKKLFR